MPMFFRILVILISFPLLIGSVILVPSELSSLQQHGREPLYWFLAEDLPATKQPHSVESHYDTTLTCNSLLHDSLLELGQPTQFATLVERCGAVTDAILESSPGFGPGHLIKSRLEILDENTALARQHLALSEQYSRRQGWIVYWRIRLHLQLGVDPLDESLTLEQALATDPLMRDLARATLVAQDARYLGGLWASYPHVQEALLSRIEKLPTTQQARFLSAVRQQGS